MMNEIISLAHGSGGKEMVELINSYHLPFRGNWKNYDNDAATLDIGNGRLLVFTTDSFTVSPVFFPGGDIGHIAMCGTINDLAVIGAQPVGISLAFVIEEGFSTKELNRILSSIKKISRQTKIPVVTGDTKVMEKGKLDRIIINTAGVGFVKKKEVLTKKVKKGDKIILSGGLGEHAVALLSKRFDYETTIVSDSKPIVEEIQRVKNFIKIAKDPTRGGIAATLHEICQRHEIGMWLDEKSIPAKPGVRTVTELLGINLYELACEGRFVCITSDKHANTVEKILKKYNRDASIIGEVTDGDTIIIQSILGKRILPLPTGRIVPRIC
jgi:hydrogenase expression/formation protein HypE